MALNDNERLQEILLLVGDKVAPVNRKWWYALLAMFVLLIPGYLLLKYSLVQLMVKSYHPPQIVYSSVQKEPLQVLEKKIFSFPDNTYSAYVKVKNINLEWGVPKQEYEAKFLTNGGTEITKVNGSTFILPASEKIIIFARFKTEKQPDSMQFILAPAQFVHKPQVDVNYTLERVSLENSDSTLVAAGIKNTTPFTIKQINLPVILFDRSNKPVGVNYTYISQVKSAETRTFQYSWPQVVAGAIRAEILPEVNVFDREIFSTQEGVSPFQNQVE